MSSVGFKGLYEMFNRELEPKTKEEQVKLRNGFRFAAQYGMKHWFVVPTTSEKKAAQVEKEFKECTSILEDMLEYYGLDVGFYVVMLIYVERYVKVVGKVEEDLIFDLMLAAAISTIKMWKDVTLRNRQCARLFGIDSKLVCDNEIDFLTEVNYNLVVDKDQLAEFTTRVLTEPPKVVSSSPTSPRTPRINNNKTVEPTSSSNSTKKTTTTTQTTKKCSNTKATKFFRSSRFYVGLLVKG